MKGASKPEIQADRPAAAIGIPNSEEQELASRRMELDRRNVAKMNKVAQMLSDTTHYITDWTHPCLNNKGEQLNVTEYFPEIKVAVDKFYSVDQCDPTVIAFKANALKKNGIRYGHLTPERGLADLCVELGM